MTAVGATNSHSSQLSELGQNSERHLNSPHHLQDACLSQHPCPRAGLCQRARKEDARPGNPPPFTTRSTKVLTSQVEEFVEKECIPADALFEEQIGHGEQRWNAHPPVIEELKTKARKLGLWNMFLPKSHFSQGAGFSNVEYGLMAEYLGKSRVASEVLFFLSFYPEFSLSDDL